MHMTVARELAAQLGHDIVTSEPGAYYLGATTPDIRVLTKWDRARTHFFDLNEYDHQSGVEGLFRERPELASAERLPPKSAAFLCGYISHLEIDEVWINDIYRPCFGERSPLKGDELANLLDRVLQYELLATTVQEAIGFLDLETLLRWRDISADVIDRPTTWDRFASRHLRAYGVETEDDLAHFLKNVPDLLDQSIREVTPERIEAFQQRSRQRALEAIRAFLS